MRRLFATSMVVVLSLVSAFQGMTSATAATSNGVQVSVLATFAQGPSAAAATNQGDVVALVGTSLVKVGPNGQQRTLASVPGGGAFGFPIGIAYDQYHQLDVAFPQSFGPPAQGIIYHVTANGSVSTVPGSDGMVAPDGFGPDSGGDLYATDIFGNGIWRIGPTGSAQLWTSNATNPLLVSPDGVKVYNGAVYTSISSGTILRIPINPDGSAGTATVWAQIPGAYFDDMVLDDRTGDVYVSRLDTNQLLQITPQGDISPIASCQDGLNLAANMVLIHVGNNAVIYLANANEALFAPPCATTAGPALFQITIPDK